MVTEGGSQIKTSRESTHSPGQEEPTLEARTHMVQVTCLQGGLNKWIQAQTPLSQLWDFDPDSDTDEKVKKWISSCCPE